MTQPPQHQFDPTHRCFHCRNTLNTHVNHKCLFGATQFRPMTRSEDRAFAQPYKAVEFAKLYGASKQRQAKLPRKPP